MARYKNADWNLPDKAETWQQASVAVLMDIRDELQSINRKLGCYRVSRALDAVDRIDRRLQKNGLLIGGPKAAASRARK